VRLLAIAVVAVAISACRFHDSAFDDRACSADSQCRPDQSCSAGLCTQKPCTVKEQCGDVHTFDCTDGRCIAHDCVDDTDCELGFACEGRFCEVACIDHDDDGVPFGAPCTREQDCDDADATVTPGSVEGMHGSSICTDGKDNDCDGLRDMAEVACAAACGNGEDDDEDGTFDYPEDFGCASIDDNSEHGASICDDGLDNDNDGKADYRKDGTGESCCTSPVDSAEQCACVTSLDGGTHHTCAVKTSATVFCWGDNAGGQLGDSSTVDRQTPVQVRVTSTAFLSGIVQVAAGDVHSCALRTDGTVWCWGRNASGQLGDSTTTQKLIAVQVSNLTGISHIAAGWDHTCGVKALDGSVWCWGAGERGQLGNGISGSNYRSTMAVQVMNITGATQVGAGERHTCARTSDGSAWCWGEGGFGQLGNNATSDSALPVQVRDNVSNLGGVSEIAVGQAHACARIGTSAVWCWGGGNSGQLGNAQSNNSVRAVQVSNLTNPAALALGSGHSCATLTTGSEVCWGLGTSGQLGNGASASTNQPVNVSALAGVVATGNGGTHSCAALETETTLCWGADPQGQLGNGSGGGSNTPSQVIMTCP
jgi:alpha-tubulin suppressor-like RCC1 family protein